MEVVSNLDTTAVDGVAAVPEVKLIPLTDIVDNKANFYAVDRAGLKPLADSIAMDGLQQYPLVTPHRTGRGKYLLLSGHRRCAAIKMLVDEGAWGVIGRSPNDRPGGASTAQVPCTVREYRSAAMAELQLILANSTARVLSNAEISKQAERMEVLLYQLKEEGYEFPGRMRDQVAAACKVSAPKLARLKVIREKLKAPEFLLLFEKDKLPEQTAYALARLPEELQKRLAGSSRASREHGGDTPAEVRGGLAVGAGYDVPGWKGLQAGGQLPPARSGVQHLRNVRREEVLSGV